MESGKQAPPKVPVQTGLTQKVHPTITQKSCLNADASFAINKAALRLFQGSGNAVPMPAGKGRGREALAGGVTAASGKPGSAELPQPGLRRAAPSVRGPFLRAYSRHGSLDFDS